MTKVYELLFEDYNDEIKSVVLSLDKSKLERLIQIAKDFEKVAEVEFQKFKNDDPTAFVDFLPANHPLRLIDYDKEDYWAWHYANCARYFSIVERELI